jgi:hypothetical protein
MRLKLRTSIWSCESARGVEFQGRLDALDGVPWRSGRSKRGKARVSQPLVNISTYQVQTRGWLTKAVGGERHELSISAVRFVRGFGGGDANMYNSKQFQRQALNG